MRQSILTVMFAGLLAGTLIWMNAATAPAQEMEVVAGGELEFQNYCAVCHGVDAKGPGIMSRFLTVRPADLTQLAKKNAGSFPFWQIYRTIDGREEVRGHGTRDMPIWGDRFRAQAGGADPGSPGASSRQVARPSVLSAAYSGIAKSAQAHLHAAH
jgi:mono/diheme cytochrome c family protein